MLSTYLFKKENLEKILLILLIITTFSYAFDGLLVFRFYGVLVLTLAIFVILAIYRQNKFLKFKGFSLIDFFVCLFLFFSFLSITVAVDKSFAFGILRILIVDIILYFIMRIYFQNNVDKIEVIFHSIVLSVAFISLVGLVFLFLFHYGNITAIQARLDVGSRLHENIIQARVFSTFREPNALGNYLVFTLPFVLYLFAVAKNFFVKIFWIKVIFLLLAVLLLTFTRAAIISGLLGFIVFSLFFIKWGFYKGLFDEIRVEKSKKYLLLGLIFVGVLFLGIVLKVNRAYFFNEFDPRLQGFAGNFRKEYALSQLPEKTEQTKDKVTPFIIERFLSTTRFDRSLRSRFEFFEKAYSLFKKSLFLGVGLGNYGEYVKVGEFGEKVKEDENIVVPNMYLDILTNSGIFSLLAFLVITVLIMKRGINRIIYFRRKKSNNLSLLVLSLLLSFFTLQIAYLTFPGEFYFYHWMLIGILSSV